MVLRWLQHVLPVLHLFHLFTVQLHRHNCIAFTADERCLRFSSAPIISCLLVASALVAGGPRSGSLGFVKHALKWTSPQPPPPPVADLLPKMPSKPEADQCV